MPAAFTKRALLGVLALLALLSLGGCSGHPTSTATTAAGAWRGTDLLWDALGDSGGFTAVGNSGVVVTSADGERWSQQPRITGQTLRGIATDGTTTVAVGTGGTVLSWPAGKPRAARRRPAGVDVPLLGVAAGRGIWIVAGSSGTVLSSTDLSSWTTRRSGTDGDVFAVAYGAGHFVAVTDLGSIVTSTDGLTWSTARAAHGLWLWGVCFGAHGFIATGAGGAILQSPDGRSWAPRRSGTTQALRGVTYARGTYLAVGSDATAVSSPNGLTWSGHSISDPGVELWRPAATASRWLAVGAGGTRLVSADLSSWTGAYTTRVGFYGVGADESTVLGAGVNGIIARQQPGGSWQPVATAPGRRELRSVQQVGGVWVVTGGGGTILTSPDAVTFTPRPSGTGAELWSAAATPGGRGRIVVVGAGGLILTSADSGRSWQAVPRPQSSTLFSVAWGPAGFVAVGVDGATVHSPDGLHWIAEPTRSRQTLRAIGADPRGYVAVGATGTIRTSTDGVHWTAASAVTTRTLRSVTPLDGAWLAVGGGGIVLRSTDGHNWRAVDSGVDSELFAITSAGGRRAVAVAGIDTAIVSTDAGVTWRAGR